MKKPIFHPYARQQLTAMAYAVFKNQENADHWLNTPTVYLNNLKPLDAIFDRDVSLTQVDVDMLLSAAEIKGLFQRETYEERCARFTKLYRLLYHTSRSQGREWLAAVCPTYGIKRSEMLKTAQGTYQLQWRMSSVVYASGM